MNEIPTQSTQPINLWKKLFLIFFVLAIFVGGTFIFIWGYYHHWFDFKDEKSILLDVNIVINVKDSNLKENIKDINYKLYRNVSDVWLKKEEGRFLGDNNVITLTEDNVYKIVVYNDLYYLKEHIIKIDRGEENKVRDIFVDKKDINTTLELQGILMNNTKQTLRVYVQTKDYLYSPILCFAWSFNILSLNINLTPTYPPYILLGQIDKCFDTGTMLKTLNQTIIDRNINNNIVIKQDLLTNTTILKPILYNTAYYIDFDIETAFLQEYDKIIVYLIDEELTEIKEGEFEYRKEDISRNDIGVKTISMVKQ